LASRKPDYDIIVVGAGPAGSRVAAGLASRGRRVAVCEQFPEAGFKESCTGILGQECVDLADIPDEIIMHRAHSASLVKPDGGIIRVARDEIQACIVDRVAFDRMMAARAVAAGAHYFYNTRVLDIVRNNDNVSLITGGKKGMSSTMTAGAVVLAGGCFGALPKRLGLGRPGDFVCGAQLEAEAGELAEVEVYPGDDIAPGFFAWLVPCGTNRVRAGLMTRRQPGAYLRRFLDKAVSNGKIKNIQGEKIKYGVIPLRTIKRTYGDRLLVVGDAAGQVKPTTGGGVFYGLLCADIAVQTLLGAGSANDHSADVLAAYERAWRHKLGGELRRGYLARRTYEWLGDSGRERLFAIIERNGVVAALADMPELSYDWHGPVLAAMLKKIIRNKMAFISG
jgi:digeranylgeranylglycerophospholipid reductase